MPIVPLQTTYPYLRPLHFHRGYSNADKILSNSFFFIITVGNESKITWPNASKMIIENIKNVNIARRDGSYLKRTLFYTIFALCTVLQPVYRAPYDYYNLKRH